ncbi:drug resistance transporter, Bcr/CflA family [Hyphomonas neptunium ATCC 15444]|uniref:Bcr/CflA family efflux transporter n=2 Tax=Hyphomonas TaxID=85 RepID=Q0BXK4_HYPNA|nr:drug resistance transporter, Bcr/CflA family [Hyphomonas neptunium ATCC 15444]
MRKVEFVAIVAGLMALNAIAIDIMLPALSAIARDTGLTAEGGDQNRQQLIIFAYVLGFGAPQLIWGPITDRFGRRAPLFIGLIGYVLTALLCIMAHSFWALLAARFLQGVFSSGARTVASAVVRDLFAGRSMASFMSLVMTIFMIVPIIAPTIGQIILYVAPWEGIFVVLAVWGALMLGWTWFRLPESLPKEARRSLEIGSVMTAYLQVIRTRVSFGYMLASGLVFGSLFAFIASSEQVFRDVFDQGDTFAYWFAGIAAALAVSNFANSRLVEKVGMRRISHIALLTFMLSSLVLTLATLAWGENLAVFFPLFALGFACFGMMGSNFSALAMEPLGKIAGTASAAYGFATTMISSIIGMIIGSQFNGTTVPLTLGFVILGAASLVVILVTEKGRLFSRH